MLQPKDIKSVEELKKYFSSSEKMVDHLVDLLQFKDAMLWIRDFNPVQPALKDLTLIHGHTPKQWDYILTQKGNCLDIDGGCVYINRKNMGKLIAFNLDERKYIIQDNFE